MEGKRLTLLWFSGWRYSNRQCRNSQHTSL